MKKIKNIAFNSASGIVNQSLTVLMNFISRIVFLRFLNVELLGINGTFTSVLSTLSLAELGFQSAVVFSLYEPLTKSDNKKISEILYILKYIYRIIGVFFIVLALVVIPFIGKILKGVAVDSMIVVYFLLQASTVAASYFIAYKRTILYASQKEYISNSVDMVCNIVFTAIRIVSLMIFRSFALYLVLFVLQTIISNIIVSRVVDKHYSFINECDYINKDLLRNIIKYVKDLFVGKLAGYVYNSTDNLVISTLIGPAFVGYLSNYTMISHGLKNLTNGILLPIAPTVGTFLAENKDDKKREKVLLFYTYVRFAISNVLIVPFVIISTDFVRFVFGREYAMSESIVLLLAFDLFIHVVHSATFDYISGDGLFKDERNISIVGAICNLLFSILFVFKFGVVGVLGGTIVSQMVFWAGRSWVVYHKCIRGIQYAYVKYWSKIVYYLLVITTSLMISKFIISYLNYTNLLIAIIVKGIVSASVSGFCLLLGTFWLEEFHLLLELLKKRRNN